MTRLLLAVVAVAVLGFLAYRAMYKSAPTPAEVPTERLQNARDAAKRIEGLQDKRSDDADKVGHE